MPRLALLLLALAALAAAVSPATACPNPGPDGPRCTKYDYMFKPQYTQVYVRTVRGVLPPRTTGRRALRHLVASTWTPRSPSYSAMVLTILDGANVPDVVDPNVQNAIVRGVTWRAGHYEVAIETATYAIQRCRDDHNHLTSCLVLIAAR